ncbi:Ig-like domain-containing protein [Oceanisphaera sp. IT1-181]|uniref:Ig-like domain-containing protein n=1 Tax=Oceanisphaera sp. IT1-181 TaxID=3081199 RepID=UPI0029CA847B|nr:Ig-like domain-containing protein [Oceanisphaera sp. IT1-181]
MNKWTRTIITPIGLFVATVGPAQAALSVVAPGPHTAISGGFPLWYEDENEVQLELCRSKAVSGGTAGAYMCTLNPEPGVFDDADPLVFPGNWPGELFWFLAETSIPEGAVPGYELEVYVAALEAAFAAENPKAGDQVGFARIRIRASVPVAGTYTVTHPYGVETFVVDAADVGRRAINMTRDIGIGTPGDFTGALGGDIGPFLQSLNGTYTETNPETGVTETFIGNPSVTEPVIGSPFDTNFVRIDGPPGIIQNNDFTLSGKVRDSVPSLPLEIERASYQRTNGQTNIEVFASSSEDAEVCYRETLALVDGDPCLTDLTPDNNGRFFVQQSPSAELPSLIVVTASSPNGTPSSLSSELIDIVKINSATYSWDDNTLRIEATSSDETQVPDLVATGFGRLSKSSNPQTLTILNLSQPPASIRVQSAAGGSDIEMVTVTGSAPDIPDNQLPLAQADSGTTTVGVPLTLQLLANDSDPDGDTPLSIVQLTQPAVGQGSVALNGSTSVVYTPPTTTNNAPLVATFTYRAQDSRGGLSEPATVTVTVGANQAPIAVNDDAATLGIPLTITVLANDSDPEGNTPLTVVNLTQPTTGQGTVSTDGTTVSYTPPTSVTSAFTASFTYQAQDSLGAQSAPATVTVSVSPPPNTAETLTVTEAEARGRRNRLTWSIQGQTSLATGNTITVEVSSIDGPVILGTTTPTPTGNWRLAARTDDLVLIANPTATIRSAFGTVTTVPVNVQ